MRWQDRAACTGQARLMEGATADDETLAKAKCRYRCPVTEQCLSWVLSLTEDEDPAGVVGGFNETERRGLRALLHAQQGAA